MSGGSDTACRASGASRRTTSISPSMNAEVRWTIDGFARWRATSDVARRAVSDLVEAGARRRDAADVVARLTGESRNALYRDSL